MDLALQQLVVLCKMLVVLSQFFVLTIKLKQVFSMGSVITFLESSQDYFMTVFLFLHSSLMFIKSDGLGLVLYLLSHLL